MKKPTSLQIRAEDVRLWEGGPSQRCLVGKDEGGVDWLIRWCGNGSYSHWTISRLEDRDEGGWYLFAHPRPHYDREPLILQIEAAEKRYRIYS